MASASPRSVLKTLSLSSLGITLLAAVAGGLYLLDVKHRFFEQPGRSTEAQVVLVERGMAVKSVAQKLEDKGVIADAWTFRLATRLFAEDKPIKAGEFEVPAGATMAEVLDVLQNATAKQYRLLVREGLTTQQVLKIIEEEDKLIGGITREIGEGRLLPDTYFFVRGESRNVLLGRMSKALDEALAEAWAAKNERAILASPVELLVMASIVERETTWDDEKPIVSGVFHNRLRKKMRLQSDPTVIYGIAQGPLGRTLKRKDMRTDTPYNTYIIYGLPPGPIANPSYESLMAAGQPAETDALFFVVDGRGRHVFAKTFKQHRANIRSWLKTRRERRQKRAAAGN